MIDRASLVRGPTGTACSTARLIVVDDGQPSTVPHLLNRMRQFGLASLCAGQLSRRTDDRSDLRSSLAEHRAAHPRRPIDDLELLAGRDVLAFGRCAPGDASLKKLLRPGCPVRPRPRDDVIGDLVAVTRDVPPEDEVGGADVHAVAHLLVRGRVALDDRLVASLATA